MARRIIRKEGLLVGGSSGAALEGAIRIAKSLPADKRVVVVFTDSIRNYMTKFLNDDWMLENNFYSQEEYDDQYFNSPETKFFGSDKTIADLGLNNINAVRNISTVQEVLEQFKSQNTECVKIKIIWIYFNILYF